MPCHKRTKQSVPKYQENHCVTFSSCLDIINSIWELPQLRYYIRICELVCYHFKNEWQRSIRGLPQLSFLCLVNISTMIYHSHNTCIMFSTLPMNPVYTIFTPRSLTSAKWSQHFISLYSLENTVCYFSSYRLCTLS